MDSFTFDNMDLDLNLDRFGIGDDGEDTEFEFDDDDDGIEYESDDDDMYDIYDDSYTSSEDDDILQAYYDDDDDEDGEYEFDDNDENDDDEDWGIDDNYGDGSVNEYEEGTGEEYSIDIDEEDREDGEIEFSNEELGISSELENSNSDSYEFKNESNSDIESDDTEVDYSSLDDDTDDEIGDIDTENTSNNENEGKKERQLSVYDKERIEHSKIDVTHSGRDITDADGNIVVQSSEDNGDRFELKYIDIDKIGITSRIRKNKSVESLVQSIKSTGLLNPIVVAPLQTKGVYVLINGYRRVIACAKAGIKSVPCVINTKANLPDIPILEAMYNHYTSYSMKEVIEYIDYLERTKGISNPSMIEFLLQLDNGDYTKLKDVLTDNDDDIVSALMNGQLTIAQAFKKLEARRKKESKEEKELKKTEQVYGDAKESGVQTFEGSGEEANEECALTDAEIDSLAISNDEVKNVEDDSLDNMVADGSNIDGFEAHKQDYKHREILDPAIRKSVLARDENTCQCCDMGGQEYISVLDVHHKQEVYLGGNDSMDNLITVCTVCHKLIHLYGRGELYIRPESELDENEAIRFKRIVKLGNKIREGMALKGMKKDELKKLDQADTIGRTKPGTGQVAG